MIFFQGKIDEMIKPVIKKISVGTTQERIDNFFTTTRISLPEKGQYQSSKRVKEAIGKVLGKSPEKTLKNEKQPKRKLEEGKTKSNPNKKAKVSEAEEKDSKLNIVLPPKNWKKEAELKAEEAKRKAIEVMKKSKQQQERNKKSKKKKGYSTIKRKVLPTHNLSESDSD